MSILVVGSVAFDSIRTPSGCRDDILGGSATYFSLAARYFAPVSLVAVVGDDFPDVQISFFQRKGIDASGLQRRRGKTFRWKGEYGDDLKTARTLETQLNVFADFDPSLHSEHRRLEFLFLGNIDPDLQRSVLGQMQRPKYIACDTMNYWIEHKRDSLLRTLSLIDTLLINDAETKELAGDSNLIRAARRVLAMGPKTIIVKRGEHGALMFSAQSVFGSPAYPVEDVVDPTGAGDSFAGGFMGYLAATGATDEASTRKAMIFGSVMASFTVSEFGPKQLENLTYPEIQARFREFRKMTLFDDI